MRRVAIESLVSSAEEVAHLRLLLSRGGVAAVPTETFYALAADPFNTDAVERIFRIKGRDDSNPLPVLFVNHPDLEALGVMADSVHQVADFTTEQIQPAPSFGPSVRASHLLGMVSTSNARFVLLLDIDRIFSSDEILAAAATTEAAA